MYFKFVISNALNLEQSTILSFGKELKTTTREALENFLGTTKNTGDQYFFPVLHCLIQILPFLRPLTFCLQN